MRDEGDQSKTPARQHPPRLARKEAVVMPHETYAERCSPELENRWILADPEGADLLAEYLDGREAHGGTVGLLSIVLGRDLTVRIVDAIDEQTGPRAAL